MRPHPCVRLLAAGLTLMFAGSAFAAPATSVRIRYAEAVALEPDTLPAHPAAWAKPAATTVGFDAHGRRFQLQLESNDRLLRQIPLPQRRALPAHTLFRGRLQGLEKSWLRITRLEGGLYGAIWDGEELYAIAPAHALEGMLDSPVIAAPHTTLVYRASDVESGFGPGACQAVLPATINNAAEQFEALSRELSAQAAAAAGLELSIGVVGDVEFGQKFADPEGTMLARLNTVDGIFSAQVGVTILATELRQLGDNGGLVFTSPSALLREFESLRKAEPALEAAGTAHLMTGRDLDGSTVGLAYVGTVCDADYASSLSQQGNDPWTGAMITAHEIGHSFGARHDGETGSPCESIPRTFLMSPVINGSDQFSQCSLDTMAPVVDSSRCLTASESRDVALEIPVSQIEGYAFESVDINVDVVSTGNQPIDDVRVDLAFFDGLRPLSVTVPNGSCSSSSNTAACELGSLAAGERRTVTIEARGDAARSYQLTASLTAPADEDAGNNNAGVTVTLQMAADGALSLQPAAFTVGEGQRQTVTATVQTAGPLALRDAALDFELPTFLALIAVNPETGSCTVVAGGVRCEFGDLPTGTTRDVRLDLAGHVAVESARLDARLSAGNDGNGNNDSASAFATVTPAVTLQLLIETGPEDILLGDTITRIILLKSEGLQDSRDVVFSIGGAPGLEIESATAEDASCAPAENSRIDCRFAGPIESGGSRRVEVRIKGTAIGSGRLELSATGLGYADRVVSAAGELTLDVGPSADVRIAAQAQTQWHGFDGVPLTVTVPISSAGLTVAENVTFRLALPAGVRVLSVDSQGGSCSLEQEAVTCALGDLPPAAAEAIEIELVAETPLERLLQPTVTAGNDAEPGNDTLDMQLNVEPNVDITMLPAPTVPPLTVGDSVALEFSLRTATQPVPDARLEISSGGTGGISVSAAAASQGDCVTDAAQVTCSLGELPANSLTRVSLTVSGERPGIVSLAADARAALDIDPGNNGSTVEFIVNEQGDVSLRADGDTVRGSVEMPFDLPALNVTARTNSVDVVVRLNLPQSLSVDAATIESGDACEVSGANISCVLGSVAAGDQHRIRIRVRSSTAGTFVIPVEATALQDANPADNSASLSVVVDPAAAPPSRDDGGSSGGGGGGGGAPDGPLLAVMLILLTGLRRRLDVRAQ